MHACIKDKQGKVPLTNPTHLVIQLIQFIVSSNMKFVYKRVFMLIYFTCIIGSIHLPFSLSLSLSLSPSLYTRTLTTFRSKFSASSQWLGFCQCLTFFSDNIIVSTSSSGCLLICWLYQLLKCFDDCFLAPYLQIAIP